MTVTVKTTAPEIKQMEAIHYMGIRSQLQISQLPSFIGTCMGELMAWREANHVPMIEAPIFRLHVINMAGDMDVSVGIAVEAPLAAAGRIQPDVLPAGRYASLIYTGIDNGIEGNRVLIEWCRANGHDFDCWDVPEGDCFAGRYELMIDGPMDDPNPANWDSQVLIKLKD